MAGEEDDYLGQRVSSLGDVDGDGTLDLFATSSVSYREFDNGGAAWLWYGPVSGSYTLSSDDYDAALLPDAADDHIGDAGGLGDHDGDGRDDLLIAQSTWSSDAGGVYVVAGR